MGLADDLLRQVEHLATYEAPKPSQAALRRAVSTAYYALFHLLTEDAAQRWVGSPEAQTAIECGFKHGLMKTISEEFRNHRWKDRHGNWRAVPDALRNVAKTFVDLQEQRHTADYNNYRKWSPVDVDDTLKMTQEAFVNWATVREDPMAGNYLIAMLLGK